MSTLPHFPINENIRNSSGENGRQMITEERETEEYLEIVHVDEKPPKPQSGGIK
jgi:hypothetical protein